MQLKCEEFIRRVSELRFNKVRKRQVNKLNALLTISRNKANKEVRHASLQLMTTNTDSQVQVNNNNSPSQGSNNNNNKWVINLSRVLLTPVKESLLSKGPNFALIPSIPPMLRLFQL